MSLLERVQQGKGQSPFNFTDVEEVAELDWWKGLTESVETSRALKANWAANERFEISKFKFKFPRARTYEMIGLVLGCIEAKFCK